MPAKNAADPKQMGSRPRHLYGLIALLIVFWIPYGHGQEDQDASDIGEQEEIADEEEEFPYVVIFEGLRENNTKDILEQISETRRLIDQPPTSLSRLRRRAEGDVERLLRAMRARGHYQASVEVDINQKTSPITITYKFHRGPVYRLGEFAIELDRPVEGEIDLPSRSKLELQEGTRARSTKIIEAETALLENVKKQGFANAKLSPRQVVVDHNRAEMDITFHLDPGPKVYFGKTSFVGNELVQARFIDRLLEWEPGKLVTPELLRTTQLNLIETGLFNSVRIVPGETPDELGQVPVSIEVKEAKHRTVEAGIRYRTDEGIGGSAGWEHRNLLGTGEQLGFDLDVSRIGWTLKGEAREPDFLQRRQALVLGTEITVEDTEAFRSRSIGSSAAIERSVGDGMDLSVGTAFRALEVKQDGDTDAFGLLSLPMSYSWDHSNNLLDPSKGGRLILQNEPFVDVFGNDVAFNRTTVGYSRYVRLKKEKPRLIFAARARAGFLFGAVRDNVPADERFYAGGGGSVRGFGFQAAGELDESNDPIGGRSLFETASEIRAQFNETLGAVVFADSGAAFGSTVPDFEEPLRIGVGTGLRYFSPIGPIRLDIGFPLSRRSSDDAFQIYVSIGQAF